MTYHKSGTIIFSACPASEQAIADAKAFIKERGFTAEQVKIMKIKNTINVELKVGWKTDGNRRN